jgi:hypothetical protein
MVRGGWSTLRPEALAPRKTPYPECFNVDIAHLIHLQAAWEKIHYFWMQIFYSILKSKIEYEVNATAGLCVEFQ